MRLLAWCIGCATLLSPLYGAASAPESRDISSDTTWKGDITVQGSVTVIPGVTLTVAPGTTVRFSDGAMLVVKGKIVAVGKPGSQITFTSLTKKEPSAWEEVSLESANGSIFAHCLFEYARWGLHSHFTHVLVKESRFRKNYGGLRFMSGLIEVRHSLFEDNSIGIRWRAGGGLIEENTITGNEVGIFIKEKGGRTTLKKNDIFSNLAYNMRVGDLVDEDVDARDNWWGNVNPADTIYDGRKEPGIGKVQYEPYLKEPVRQVSKESR